MKSFEPQHYIPVLRWKEAERFALAQLDAQVLTHVTPLIELIPENFMQSNKILTNEEAMYHVAGHLAQCWDIRPIYLDLLNLPSLQSARCLALLGSYADSFRFSLIPVTGLQRDSEYDVAVRNSIDRMKQGACLRLTREDLRSQALGKSVSDILSLLSLEIKDTDLLIDCETLDGSLPRFHDLCRLIPNILEWRNFVVTGGAFPEDLRGYPKNKRHEIPRLEWISWRDQANEISPDTRLPNFSDYTVQYAHYSPRRPGKMRYSASIRYTVEDSWMLMRGEDVFRKNGPGFQQYHDLAIMLKDRPEYCGEEYSSGDRYIKEMSLNPSETGAAPQWLQAGINHHITFVVHQLASL